MADGIVHYPWYFNDWLGSGTRAEMTLEDRAIYRDLLDHQAADGSIADSVNAIANLAMCSQAQAQRFIERWGDELFPVSDDGRRQNAKQAEIRSAIIKSLDKRSRAGQAGAEARWKKKHGKANGNRIADAMPRAFGSGFDSSSSVEGESEGKPRPPNRRRSVCTESQAAAIYAHYPKKTARRAALKAIQNAACRLSDAGHEDPLTHLAERVRAFAASPRGQPPLGDRDLRPNPATFFNEDRFDDDLETWKQPNDNRSTSAGNGKSSTRSKPSAAAERRAAERRRDYVEDDAGLRILNQTG